MSKKVLEFSGRLKGQRTLVKGNGTYQVEGELYIINDNEKLGPIEDTSLRIRNLAQYEKFEEPQTSTQDLEDLLERIMQTVIGFCKERNMTEIDTLDFRTDGLGSSVVYDRWTPSTDASLAAYGHQDDKLKKIGEIL